MYTASYASPVKDGRRILGEKPANACLSPAAFNRSVGVDKAATSPLKRPFSENTPSSSPTKKKQLLPPPSFAGQKRGIDQVEPQQEQENAGGASWRIREESKPEDVGNTQSGPEYDPTTPSTRKPSNATDTYRSQEDPIPQERQPEQDSPIKPQQQHPSSAMTVSQAPSHSHDPTRSVPEDPETRKVFIQEKASLLRNRIQNAMRHVKNAQLDRRLSDLEAHSHRHPRLHKPSSRSYPLHTSTTANAIATSPLSDNRTPRTLQPAPDLKSTRDTGNTVSGLTTPPLSQNANHDPMKTPTQIFQSRQPPMQLSSPAATLPRSFGPGDEDEPHQARGRNRTSTPDIDMPSQKDDAVDGLLKLMST